MSPLSDVAPRPGVHVPHIGTFQQVPASPGMPFPVPQSGGPLSCTPLTLKALPAPPSTQALKSLPKGTGVPGQGGRELGEGCGHSRGEDSPCRWRPPGKPSEPAGRSARARGRSAGRERVKRCSARNLTCSFPRSFTHTTRSCRLPSGQPRAGARPRTRGGRPADAELVATSPRAPRTRRWCLLLREERERLFDCCLLYRMRAQAARELGKRQETKCLKRKEERSKETTVSSTSGLCLFS